MRENVQHVPEGWEGRRVRVVFGSLELNTHELSMSQEVEGVLAQQTPLGIVVERDGLETLLIAYRAITLVELDPPTPKERTERAYDESAYTEGL